MHRFWETVIEPVLKATGPKTIVEIGSDSGRNTTNLLEFCRRSGAQLHVIDPLPKYSVSEWRERYGELLTFHEQLSLDALPLIDDFDAVLIDGDHNWYTVFNELKLIDEKRGESSFPAVMLHDIEWPYGQRDLYYNPEEIPAAHRKPYENKGMVEGEEGLVEEGGLNRRLNNAVRENEPRGGVLTAVEDFMEQSERSLDLTRVPGLHGLGILVPSRARERNAELAQVLDGLELSPFAEKHVRQLERDRLDAQMRLQEERRKLRAERQNVSNLVRWIEDLDEGSSALLASRQWKAAQLIGTLRRKAFREPRKPAAPEQIRKASREFRVWREEAKRSKIERPEQEDD